MDLDLENFSCKAGSMHLQGLYAKRFRRSREGRTWTDLSFLVRKGLTVVYFGDRLSFKKEMKRKRTWERGSRSNSTKHELLQWESSVVFQQCPSQEVVMICTPFLEHEGEKGLA